MSGGYCEVDFSDVSDDAHPVEFFDVITVKAAKKEHACSECSGPIAKGDSYQRLNYKFEGEMCSEAICAPCAETKQVFNYHMCGGSVWFMMREEWANGAHIQACVQRLSSAKAKEHMLRQWRKWKGL